MKTTGKLLIAGLALVIANAAMAGATMHDVETAVNVNHDYRQAENLIRDIVTNHPDDARDHWVYAQILHHNNKDDLAQKELSDAKRLDPKYSFVKEPRKVAQFEASLNLSAHASAAPAAPAIIPAPAPAPAIRHEATIAQLAQSVQPLPEPAPHKSSHTWIWVVLILAVVGIAGFIFARRVQEGDRREEEERIKAARQEQLKDANALLESVKPFKLDLRIANPPRPDLVSQLEDVERDLIALIERLAQMPVAHDEVNRLSRRLSLLRQEFEHKPESAPAAAAQQFSPNQPGQFNDNEFSPVGRSAAPAYQQPQMAQPMQAQPMQAQPMQPVYQPVMQPVYQQPSPVYIEENNSGIGAGTGFVAGMVMGSLLGGDHHEREVVREVREVREIREEPRYERGEPAQSDIDFGVESSADSGGSDVDFGSSDSDDN